MKRTKLRILLFLLFIGGLILIPQKSKAAEAKVEAVPVNISVKYGQTEARTILDMINEARTNPAYAWYWDATDTIQEQQQYLQVVQPQEKKLIIVLMQIVAMQKQKL